LVGAGVVIFNGALIALNTAGYIVPAGDVVGNVNVGRAESYVDNTGGANGAKEVIYAPGVLKLATSGANAVLQADVGKTVYSLDDQTVVKAAGVTNNIAAGMLEEIDADGDVWVRVNS
jgi:hypothetical protein